MQYEYLTDILPISFGFNALSRFLYTDVAVILATL